MPATDLELLLRFSRDGDETAFTTLVNRHLPMVYSAACRILFTDKHLAPDIAQRVFTNLVACLPRVIAHMEAAAVARVEEGSSPPSVMGWLHRDTRFAAMEILRRESRRRRETVAVLTDVVSENSEPDWTRLRPFLDESLDELPDSDLILGASRCRCRRGRRFLQAPGGSICRRHPPGPGFPGSPGSERHRSDNINSQHLGLDILGRVGTGPGQDADPIAARRLGDAADDVVVALMHVANHSQLAERRTRARKLLDRLEPTLRRDNPDFDRWLTEQEATERFRRKMAAGDVGIAELQDGLTRHPDASHDVAKRLAAYGPEARAALPSLHQALAALEPSETDSRFDRSTKLERRGQIVDAMRKLAPDQPSPIFSRGDVRLIFEPLSTLSGPGAATGRAEALQEVLAPLSTGGLEPAEELRPERLRQILEAIGQVDPALRDAMFSASRSLDPTFR